MKCPSVMFSPLSPVWLTLMTATVLLAAPWHAGTAAPVTAKQAAAVAAGWLTQDRVPLGEHLGTSVQRVETFNDKSGSPLYYVVYLDPSGLVIVAGDDLVEPIIGFAPAGRFDPSPANPLGALVSSDLSARVAHARQMSAASPDKPAADARAKWGQLGGLDGAPVPKGIASVSDVRIAPFVRSMWDQGTAGNLGNTACYNYYTPPYGDGNKDNYWAGCVATAMAQIMRYYPFPTAAVGSAGFTISADGSPLTYYLHGGDLYGGPYDWSSMPLVATDSTPVAQRQAIGALVADAGATVGMSYRASGSSSSPYDARNELVNTFQFANARYGGNGGGSIGAGLTGMVNPNLDARYPVLLGIRGTGGHAVVADGYGYSASTLYHHLNLGWSGVSTAWYALPLIDTGNSTYTVVDSCIYNTYTNGTGEIISGRVLDQIGRPVVSATVTATRSAGGTYTATTDTNGIYALARIPSASSYLVTVAKANYTTVNGNFLTGTSWDNGATSGNYWGADFTMNMLTTVLDHLVWNPVGTPHSLNTPFLVSITAQNLLNGLATGFSGPVALSAFAAGAGPSTTLIGNLTYNSWLSGSEMTLGYAFTPSTNLQVTAVRGYNTDKVSVWTTDGVLLGSQAVSASSSWTEAALATPVYLTGGTTYVVGAHIPAGRNGYFRTSGWPTTFGNGTVGQNFYQSYGDLCPTSVYGTGQGALVDLRYQVVFTNSVALTPTSSGTFVNGVWSGGAVVSGVAANVVLKADDGAGHTALSNPFNVVDPNAAPPVITTDPQSRTNNTGDNATFSVVATSGATPSYFWRRNGSSIAGANGSTYSLNNVQLPDSGSLFSCLVSNAYGYVTSRTAILTVVCTNVVVAAQPSVTLNAGAIVYAVAPLSDGSVIFGGHFTNVNGLARSRLARLLPNGALDMTWNPAPNAPVFALAVSGTSLYVGGAFTSIGTYGRSFIAKLSTTGNGVADATWNPSADYRVNALAVDGGFVYAAGYFDSIGGQARSCIAKLSSSGVGAADPTWNPNPTLSGDYPEVMALAVSGGSVYAGGYFTGIGGQARNYLARLSSSGTGAADATWNPNADWIVYSIAPNGPDVYVAGGFTAVGTRARNCIAKLSSAGTGAADATWNPSPDGGVWTLAVRGLCVYAGGAFTNIGGLHRANLAKLSSQGNGTTDAAWEADCNDEVNAVVPGNSALHVGGWFTQVAGQPRPGLAALTYTPLRLLSPRSVGGTQFQCTLAGERGQAYEILASTNLQNWATLAFLTNSTGTTNFTDATPGLRRRLYRARQLP
jgi:hypothetical protein